MPEKFSFPVLVESSDDQDIRTQLIEKITRIFSRWLCKIEEMFLWDSNDPELMIPLLDFTSVHCHPLSSSQSLIVYFTGRREEGTSLLSISRLIGAVVYQVTLPTIDIRNHPNDLLQLLRSLFLEISAMGLHCVVTGGAELEMEPALRSVSDVVQSAGHGHSLAEYLCCDRNDAAQLRNFILVQESGNASLFRRMPYKEA